jgi:hypothetical protein
VWQTAVVSSGLYVYAIGRADHPLPGEVEAIDGSAHVDVVVDGRLAAFCSRVELDDFSQAVIDARANDVEWLGAIGYRHQSVMMALMRGGTILPLRAFTLFGSDEALHATLREQGETFTRVLARLDGRQEWTIRIELDPQRWSDALIRRVDTLRDLSSQIETAPSGRAFLLKKKLDEEKKRASRDAEQQLVAEIERAVVETLACDTVAESRAQRNGAFPQINVLIERDEEARLQELRERLDDRYRDDGVAVVLTGPWPPYSFAAIKDER